MNKTLSLSIVHLATWPTTVAPTSYPSFIHLCEENGDEYPLASMAKNQWKPITWCHNIALIQHRPWTFSMLSVKPINDIIIYTLHVILLHPTRFNDHFPFFQVNLVGQLHPSFSVSSLSSLSSVSSQVRANLFVSTSYIWPVPHPFTLTTVPRAFEANVFTGRMPLQQHQNTERKMLQQQLCSVNRGILDL